MRRGALNAGPEAVVFSDFARSAPVRGLLANPPRAIAVALSGGPDSMALLALLSRLDICEIHALSVDHGLRPESAQEVKQVARMVQGWPRVRHHVLVWGGEKPKAAIMEKARAARYALLRGWCGGHGINQLWLGHNRTDQAETFLFRLAKGSGLDGLGAMQAMQPAGVGGFVLVRPLLGVSKAEISAFCDMEAIPYVVDPSNVNRAYARPRLRQALPVLAAEGLSEKRLSVTAARLARARQALDYYAGRLCTEHATLTPGHGAVALAPLLEAPPEIRLRVVRRILAAMAPEDAYGPRLESLEGHLDGFFAAGAEARRFSLGGFIFAQDVKKGLFSIQYEAS